MEEEMNKQKEENTLNTEFAKRVDEFIKEIREKFEYKSQDKGLIVFAIDKSDGETSKLLASINGKGKLLLEMLVQAMKDNSNLKNLIQISLKMERLFSFMKDMKKI